MNFRTFETEAHRMWEEIPAEYKAGIDGIVVKREAEIHPEHDDYYTLGMCFTEPYPSGYMGPESTRSILVLYHGSFVKLARKDPDFPWEEELWETITHELRHHLEFLAEEDDLEALDYALEESYKRGEALDFDPWYFQSGQLLAPRVYRVEYDVYIERPWKEGELRTGGRIEFDWDGRRWAVPVPDELGDLHYLWVQGVETGDGSLQLVLVRELSLRERLGRLLGRRRSELFESDAQAEEVGAAPGSPGPEDGRPGRAAGGPPPPRGGEGDADADEGRE